MEEYFIQLQKDLSLLSNKDNLICFLIFGSILTNYENANDFDGIVVVKKIDSSLKDLFEILAKRYSKLDMNIYTHEEILNNLSFYMREFKLEYLARGLCIYGENIFQKEFKKICDYEYKQSMLVRSIERMQMMRQKYFLTQFSPEEKLAYIKKYFLRISKSILILQNLKDDLSVDKMTQDQINQVLLNMGMFNSLVDFDRIETLDKYFELVDISLSEALLKCKRDFDLQYNKMCKI